MKINFQRGQISYLSVRHNVNPTYISNFSFVLTKTTLGQSVLNMTGVALVEAKKTFFYLTLNGQKDLKNSNYDKLLLTGNIDTCKIGKDGVGNFIMKILLPNILEHATFLNCPQKKGEFHLREFPLTNLQFLPAYILPQSGKWELTIVGKGKFLKSTVPFLTVKMYGTRMA